MVVGIHWLNQLARHCAALQIAGNITTKGVQLIFFFCKLLLSRSCGCWLMARLTCSLLMRRTCNGRASAVEYLLVCRLSCISGLLRICCVVCAAVVADGWQRVSAGTARLAALRSVNAAATG
jgi:hypothetical protein